jgi:hypothetical protein
VNPPLHLGLTPGRRADDPAGDAGASGRGDPVESWAAEEPSLAPAIALDYHARVPPVSSQRARETRILAKLTTGTLRPATPRDTPLPVSLGTKPSGEDRCRGCDELQADWLVGDRRWHYLCVLFWQGRSEASHAPETLGASGVTPDRPRWVIVTRVDRPEVVPALQRSFAGSAWVEVVVDRRRGERRHGTLQPARDRRLAGRRSADQDPAQRLAFRLALRGDGFETYEATGPAPGRCPECGAMVSVELPRFAEPPFRLDLTVVHETITPDRARHVVELQSLSATGRVLLASRLFVRTRTEPA